MSTKLMLAGIGTAAALAIVPAAPAQAIPAGSCHLHIQPVFTYSVRITVTCAPRAAGDVRAVFKLYGEDTFSDDLLYTVETKKAEFTFDIPADYLNEDTADRDEIYAQNWIRKPDGSLYKIRTGNVTGWYGFGTRPRPGIIVDRG